MGRMLGSDPEQLDGLGDALARSADRLNAIGGEINSLLAYAGWEGGDADEFRWQWQHQLTGILHTAAAQAQEAARLLWGNAQEQRSASSDHVGGGIAVMPSPAVDGLGSVPGVRLPWDDIELVMLVSGLAAFPSSVLGAAKDGLLGSGLKGWVDGLPEVLRRFAVDDLAGPLKLEGVLSSAAKVGPLQFLSTMVDGVGLVDHLAHGEDAEAFNSGVNLALGVGAIALTVGLLPVAPAAAGIGVLALGGAQLAFNVYTAFDEDGAWEATQNAVSSVTSAVGDTVSAVGDVAEAVGGVVSGGVDAVANFFGF